MAGAQRSQGERPWCGMVQVEVAELRCEVAPQRATKGLCEFTVPLLAPGPGPGAPLSCDAILDAHVALEQGLLPQELTRSAVTDLGRAEEANDR